MATWSSEVCFHSVAGTSEHAGFTAGCDMRVGGSPAPGIVVGAAAFAAVTPSSRVTPTCRNGCAEPSVDQADIAVLAAPGRQGLTARLLRRLLAPRLTVFERALQAMALNQGVAERVKAAMRDVREPYRAPASAQA